MIEIVNAHCNNKVLYTSTADTIAAAVIEALQNGVNLWGANLLKADFQNADLRLADFRGAILRGANFQGADLRGANFYGTNLRHTVFKDANLQDVDFRKAFLASANLQNCQLQGSNFTHAAILHSANFQGANLYEAAIDTVTLTLVGSCHVITAYPDRVTIGCETHTYAYWLEHYETIGRYHDYTPAEIEEYGKLIRKARAVMASLEGE